VETDPEGRILAFREKPSELVPGTVNAGTYVLEPRALSDVPRGVMVSIERATFPNLIERGERLFAFVSEGYWRDLGTPEAYLQAHFDALEGKLSERFPSPLMGQRCRVAPDAVVERMVVLGDDCSVASQASVDRSVLHEGVSVERGAIVERSVLGDKARVGAGAVVKDSLLASDARVAPGARLKDGRVSPGELVG
jgi:mannose-1-phosphate guanylyltransferase